VTKKNMMVCAGHLLETIITMSSGEGITTPSAVLERPSDAFHST